MRSRNDALENVGIRIQICFFLVSMLDFREVIRIPY